jgi:hypothetical protein
VVLSADSHVVRQVLSLFYWYNKSTFIDLISVLINVADPDPFDTDPDPAFHFDTDPAFQFDTDPDPTFFYGSGSFPVHSGNVPK